MEVLFRNGDRSNIKISKTYTYKALIIWHNYKKRTEKIQMLSKKEWNRHQIKALRFGGMACSTEIFSTGQISPKDIFWPGRHVRNF
jgi:hypothetical protein